MKIPYRYAVALSAALGLFMVVLDNTIVNVALNAMRISFIKEDPNITTNSIQWIITAYFLSQAAVIPIAGYLSNRFGLKRMFLIALAIFSLGSLLCGFSHELDLLVGGYGLPMLIAFRVLQGVGGGMLFPLATSISFNVFPPAERAKSSAVIAVPILLAPTLGPTVGGVLVDSFLGWPWIFFINVPVGLFTMYLINRLLTSDFGQKPAWLAVGGPIPVTPAADAGEPTRVADASASAVGAGPATPTGALPRGAIAGAQTKPGNFDFLGLVLSMVGTIMIVYSFALISETREGSITPRTPNGEINGWGYWLVWTLLAAGLAILAIFSVFELKVAKDPVLDLRLFGQNIFLVSTIMTWVVRAVIFGSFFILPLFLEQFRGQSAIATGLALMPQGIGAGIGIISGSRLYDRVGPRVQVIMGIVALTLSSVLLIGVDKNTDGWTLAPILLIRGIGFGWSNLPLQTVALSKVSGPALSKATSLYNATAQVFSSIGIAVLATIFSEGLASRLTEAGRAAQGRPSTQAITEAAAAAVSNVFVIVTIGTALTVLVAIFLPKRSLKQEQQDEARQSGKQPETTAAPTLAGD